MEKILRFLFGIHFDLSSSFSFPRPCLFCQGSGQQVCITFYIRLLRWIIPVATVNFCPTHMWEWNIGMVGEGLEREIEKSKKGIKEQIEMLRGFEEEMKKKYKEKEKLAEKG